MSLEGTEALTSAAFAVLLAFGRVSGFFLLAPGVGETVIPVRVRLLAALSFTVLLFPAVNSEYEDIGTRSGFAAFSAEVLIGAFLGALLRLVAMSLQIAGTIISNSVSLAQIIGGPVVDPQPALATLMYMAGIALVLAAGGHVALVAHLMDSYDALSPGQHPNPTELAEMIVSQTVLAMALALQLAIPFLLPSVLYNLTLAFMSRAMPQLMIVFVGAPALAIGVLAFLAILLPGVLGSWLDVILFQINAGGVGGR